MDPKIPVALISDLVKNGANILELIYKDLAQPGCRQVGKALETVLGLGNTILIPLQMLNTAGSVILEKNMEDLRHMLIDVSEKDIVPIPPEIGVPIIEKLMFTQDRCIADLFCTLLANAANVHTCAKVHPSFAKIIERLSPDEALFLNSIKNPHFPIYAVRAIIQNLKKNTYLKVSGTLIAEEINLPLKFTSNMPSYLNNLEASGIISVSFVEYLSDSTKYDDLEKMFLDDFQKAFPDETLGTRQFQRGSVHVTPYGAMFLDAVKSKDLSRPQE